MYYEWEKPRGTAQTEEKRESDVLLTLALIVAIAVFCYAAVNLYHIYTEYKKGTDEYNHIEEMAVTDRAPDAQYRSGRPGCTSPSRRSMWILTALKSVNEDVVGWIYVEALDEYQLSDRAG